MAMRMIPPTKKDESFQENAKGRIKDKLKEKPFNTMSRDEKDELLYELLIMNGLIEGAN